MKKRKKAQNGFSLENYKNQRNQDYMNFLQEERQLNKELYGSEDFRNDNLNQANLVFSKNGIVPQLAIPTLTAAPGITYGKSVRYSPDNVDYFSPVGPRPLNRVEHKQRMQKQINDRINKFKKGGVIEDNMGQWNHPGEVTKINSNNITMKGVEYPVLGVSDKGDIKLMMPNQDYKFNGSSVTEYPMAKSGIHIKESKKGTFTKAAKEHGKGVQEFASQVLSHKDNYSSAMVKKANFAKNASKWHKGQLGMNLPGSPQLDPNGNLFNQNAPILNWGSQQVYAPTAFTQDAQFRQFANNLPQPTRNIGEELGGATGILNTASQVIGGIQMIKADNDKKDTALQAYKLAKLTRKAANSIPDKPKRKYYRPEDALFNPEEMIPSYGTGSNFLAKDGAKLQLGGVVPFFDNIGMNRSSNLGQMLGSAIGGGGGTPSGASNLGSTIGGTAGTLIGGPIGGAIGGFLGGAIGGIAGGHTQKMTNRYNRRAQNNLTQAAFEQGTRNLQDQYTGFMKDGGMAMGGQLQTHWGGRAETVSTNPYLPDGGESVLFKGNSHENDGIGITFGNNKIEVEGGEPAVKLRDGGSQSNLVVFGNMKIPDYGVMEIGDKNAKGKKFKSYVNELNKSESKQNKILDKNMKLIDDNDLATPFDKLKLSSGQAMITGANMNLKNIAKKKEAAANVQNAILDTAEEFNLDSDALSKGNIKKAKKGTYATAQDGAELKKIARSEVEDFLKQGWKVDPENPNRLFKKTSSPGGSKTVYMQAPGKGGEEFNKAFAKARLNKENQFTYKGKKYTTDLYKGSKQTINTPGTERTDYMDIYDPESRTIIPTITGKPLSKPQETPAGKRDTLGDMFNVINAALPYLRPSNQLPLDPNQLSGEMYALATNNLDPVQAQLYHPLLQQVSDISLQDQMNANQADFNAISKQVSRNPAALSSLAAQKYAANSNVLGEQFRLNQAQRMNTYNNNRATLNDAQLKNLGILDQQYVRQSQAKSNTKATAQAALNSISSKIQQNKLENKTLGIYENLYNYRYLPNGQAFNLNGLAEFNFPTVGENPQMQPLNNVTATEEYRQKYDKLNMPIGSEVRSTRTSRPKAKNGSLVKYMKDF